MQEWIKQLVRRASTRERNATRAVKWLHIFQWVDTESFKTRRGYMESATFRRSWPPWSHIRDMMQLNQFSWRVKPGDLILSMVVFPFYATFSPRFSFTKTNSPLSINNSLSSAANVTAVNNNIFTTHSSSCRRRRQLVLLLLNHTSMINLFIFMLSNFHHHLMIISLLIRQF